MEGEKRTVIELEVDEVRPSLKYAAAKVNKVARGATNGRSGTGTSHTSGGEDRRGSRTPAADAEPPF